MTPEMEAAAMSIFGTFAVAYGIGLGFVVVVLLSRTRGGE